jgi:hypothetical protein
MTEMTPERLAAIKAREAAATKGPWYGWAFHGMIKADRVFCAHAREDIPALLSEVERLEKENEKTREAMNEWAKSDARARAEVERLRRLLNIL